MFSKGIRSSLLVGAGFIAGSIVMQLPVTFASESAPESDLSTRKFHVFIDEVKQNFVFGDEFVGNYRKEIVLSDGTKRTIELTPMVHKGMDVIEFKDTEGHTYMGLNGATTNGSLMVRVVDVSSNRRMLREQGWKLPDE